MDESFAVHLGGGMYLDASGDLKYGPPSGAQIYEAPGGFKLDLAKVKDVFKDLSGLLPADEATAKKWTDWGIRGPVLKFLSNIAGVTGIVATAIAVYAWAIKVLIDIMDLMAKDEGMSDELKKTLFSIKDQLQSSEEIARANHMIGIHSEFDGRIDKIHGKLIGLAVAKPTGAARAQVFAEMLAVVEELAQPLSNLRDQAWATTYNPDAYKGRAFASELLVTKHADGTLAPVLQESPSLSVFDYRLGVPMLLYGAVTFTALLQVAMPWFRSAGLYSPHLRKTADAIDRFVLQMQTECLARTEYSAEKVLGQQIWPVADVAAPAPGPGWGGASGSYSYAVGAFDLVSYNDAFLRQRWYEQFAAGADPGLRGLFNYHWQAPANLLADIANAADDQAELDYTNMQVATGMIQLIKTAAWLRCLSTPPRRSQTVSGYAAEGRVFREAQPTTATSPPLPPIKRLISRPATLNHYDARNRIRIMTQEPGYKPVFRYRVVLRTLDCANPETGWINQDYVRDVWKAEYQPTQDDPRCKRLKTKLSQSLILQEVVLYEGPSPAQTATRSGVARLRATTFDWYVPKGPAFSTYIDPNLVVRAQSGKGSGGGKEAFGTGGISIHLFDAHTVSPPVMQVMDAPSPWIPPFEMYPSPLAAPVVAELSDMANVTAPSEIALDKAERRHVRQEYVEVKWQLTWTAEKLEVTLTGRPDNRPFQVHLVIEEAVYSGETLPDNAGDILSNQLLVETIHTPFVAELVNQLVMVPEDFFALERVAIADLRKLLDEMERKYAKQAPVGLGDPIVSLHRAIRELTARSSSTATLAKTLDLRAQFAASEAPELWNELFREQRSGLITRGETRQRAEAESPGDFESV